MIKGVITCLFIMLFALPVMAEPALPDEHATHMQDVIDMSVEVEHEIVHTDHGNEKGGLPQFDVSTFSSQVFWLLIMFVVLYTFFAKSALPKISATMENRMASIRMDLEQADKISSEASETKDSYEQAMSGAHDEARDYVQTIVSDLRAQAKNDTDTFREKSEKEIQSLETLAEQAKDKIKNELANSAFELTQDIVKTLTSLDLKDADIQKFVTAHMDDTTGSKTRKKAA